MGVVEDDTFEVLTDSMLKSLVLLLLNYFFFKLQFQFSFGVEFENTYLSFKYVNTSFG